jgi:hypothetical protein
MQARRDGATKPKQLHWQTAWKCLAEALTGAFLAISGTSIGQDTALPIYTRLFCGFVDACMWLIVLGWLYTGVRILRTGPRLGQVDGFLSNKPWVHLIISLILLAASLWMANALRDGAYTPSALPVLLILLICWLINIFCWLHVAALRKLGPPAVAPTKERWWIERERPQEEKTAPPT